MARNREDLANSLLGDETGGLLTGFLADEAEFDRRSLWRLGFWGAGSVGAVIIAVLANQSSVALRRDHIAAADLTRQSQQLQSIARQSQNEATRLASEIDTLNKDRDRLYARVTVLEQGLDSVTGSIGQQSASQNKSQKAALGSPQAGVAASRPVPDLSPRQQANTAPPVQTRLPSPTTVASATPATSAGQAETSKNAARIQSEPPLLPVIAPAASLNPAKTVIAKPSTAKPSAAANSPADSSSADLTSAASSSDDSSSAAPITQAKPFVASKSEIPPPDKAGTKSGEEPQALTNSKAGKLEAAKEPEAQNLASIAATGDAEPAVSDPPDDTPVAHTEFGVDLGSASSIKGLRALWHGILRSNASEVNSLHPIIVLKERGRGSSMQLRLVAGPLSDAAAAAKICAVLAENRRPCETSVYDGQRLAMTEDAKENASAVAIKKPGPSRPSPHHRHRRQTARVEEPIPVPEPPPPPPPAPKPSTFSSFFSR